MYEEVDLKAKTGAIVQATLTKYLTSTQVKNISTELELQNSKDLQLTLKI